MHKRAQSAAAKDEVNALQDVREKVAKMLGYKVHTAKKTSATTATTATTTTIVTEGKGVKAKEDGDANGTA